MKWIVRYYDGLQWYEHKFNTKAEADQFFEEVRNEPPYPYVEKPVKE